MKIIGFVIFAVFTNILAIKLGSALDKRSKISAWWSIASFILGIVVGVLYFSKLLV